MNYLIEMIVKVIGNNFFKHFYKKRVQTYLQIWSSVNAPATPSPAKLRLLPTVVFNSSQMNSILIRTRGES